MKHLYEFSTFYKTIISVDIDQNTLQYLNFDTYEWLDHLYKHYVKGSDIVFLYNGINGGFDLTLTEYKNFLYETSNYNNDFIEMIDNAEFFDKEYAFLRPAAEHFSEKVILDFLKYLKSKNTHTIQDLSVEEIDEVIKLYGDDFYYHAKDTFYYPTDLYDFLKDLKDPIEIMGGHAHLCLNEIEIMLKFLNKKFNRNKDFIF